MERIDLGAIPMFERMRRVGIGINPRHFREFSEVLQWEMDSTLAEIEQLVGHKLNPNSSDQVGDLLYDELKLTVTRLTKGGKRATDKKTLAQHQGRYPVVTLLRQYREYQKLKSTYADAIPLLAGPDGRLHGDFRTTTTPTGQLAIGEPNLLAIPAGTLGKEIRRGFVPDAGRVLGSWDLQGFHFRTMAHLSRDPYLCRLFKEGRDVHSETAARMFGIPLGRVDKNKHRRPAKTVGLGIINGLTEVGLSAQFDLAAAEEQDDSLKHNPEECKEFIRAWMDVCRGVKQYQLECIMEARRYGMVRDQWGRIRYLPNIHSKLEQVRSEAERQSFSHKIQATSHGILKQIMANIWTWMQEWWQKSELYWEFLLQIHDELVAELDERIVTSEFPETVRRMMCDTVPLRVPLDSSMTFARNWAELK